jgi:hypothetical protein
MSKRIKNYFQNFDVVKTMYAVIFIGLFVAIIVLSFRGPGPVISITIESDEFLADFSSEGNGTQSNPYIIEEYTLDAFVDNAIIIRHTTKYFTIRNCAISNAKVGILLENVTFGLIQHNTFEYNNVSIQIDNSANISVVYSSFTNSSDFAVKLTTTAVNCSIFQNNFIDNNISGGSQALDNGITNLWYYPVTSLGNYWSDIGLNPTYSINGTAGSVDLHPETDPLSI